MALVFMDGFDHYATADGLKKWNAFGIGVSINATAGRRGGGCLALAGTTRFVDKTLPAAKTTLIVGFAYDTGGGSGADMLAFLDGATIHCGVRLGASGEIIAFRGTSATVLGTSANDVVPSDYCYIECKVTIDDTAGVIEVRVNGAAVLSLSGIDTRNAGNAYCTGYRIRSVSTAAKVDDHYVCDTSGTTNNDYLGDVRIEPFFPSGAGTHQQFTPSTGTDHAALVDESAPSTVDYLTGGAAGTKETFTISPVGILPSSDLIVAVQVNNYCAKSDAGGSSVANLIRSGTSEAKGPTVALSTSYGYVSSIHEINPDTGQPWLLGEVELMEAGLEVIS